jgi:hypothetical protein
MGVAKLMLTPNSTARTNGFGGCPIWFLMETAMRGPTTAAELLETMLVRSPIKSIKPLITNVGDAPPAKATKAGLGTLLICADQGGFV